MFACKYCKLQRCISRYFYVFLRILFVLCYAWSVWICGNVIWAELPKVSSRKFHAQHMSKLLGRLVGCMDVVQFHLRPSDRNSEKRLEAKRSKKHQVMSGTCIPFMIIEEMSGAASWPRGRNPSPPHNIPQLAAFCSILIAFYNQDQLSICSVYVITSLSSDCDWQTHCCLLEQSQDQKAVHSETVLWIFPKVVCKGTSQWTSHLFCILYLFCFLILYHLYHFVMLCFRGPTHAWPSSIPLLLSSFGILRSQEANALECHAMPRAVPKTPRRFESKASCASVGTRPCECV
jgi:hypothetical protein